MQHLTKRSRYALPVAVPADFDIQSIRDTDVESTDHPVHVTGNHYENGPIDEMLHESHFLYDGCHKIILVASAEVYTALGGTLESLYPINQLQRAYENSCGLRFITSCYIDHRGEDSYESVVEQLSDHVKIKQVTP